jgi:hypothetical protein
VIGPHRGTPLSRFAFPLAEVAIGGSAQFRLRVDEGITPAA